MQGDIMNQEIIIKELNKLLDRAIKHNEVPVAALIVYNNKIIAK
jgi:tRNA(Arg) A34 adenosine deaminase TadA